MAWTDRKTGYLELFSGSVGGASHGYYRGEKKFLSDFFVSIERAGADLFRTNARYIDVMPEGFSAAFELDSCHLSLDVSLLFDEQAFSVCLGRSGSVPEGIGAGLLLPRESAPQGAALSPDGPSWIRYELDGITLWQNDSGMAVSSGSPFRLEDGKSGALCLFPGPDADDSARVEALRWYVVFEDDGELARRKAVRLVAEDAIAAHRAKIAEFFWGCAVSSGDERLDDALRWAAFSGWMMVTEDRGKGIWAGLPWFRDNWGRDTFVALTGILLVTGRFAEAREVLTGFARHQNADPSSPEYGRIPNRYRGDGDVIYNTADGTLWFIRSLWEYVQYSGDTSILEELRETVDLALEADAIRRTDSHGFLLHGDADTWMDARIGGREAFSPRGDRASDVQALWYTALRIGSYIARLLGENALAESRGALADRVRESFPKYFWCDERQALADRLPPGTKGESRKDFRVRPNQLLALTAPAILRAEGSNDADFLPREARERVVESAQRSLVSPFGLFSLCPDDPLFHPRHENPEWYHKDAAYHNGTIWPWNTGAYVSAASRLALAAELPALAAALLSNETSMILDAGCCGALAENIHAEPGADGNPVFSGAWSQAWSVSEFARNVFQDVIGFMPRLADNRIDLDPHLPAGLDHWSASPPFGPAWRLNIALRREIDGIRCILTWDVGADAEPLSGIGVLSPPRLSSRRVPHLLVNGRPLVPGVPLSLSFPASPPRGRIARPAFPSQAGYLTSIFPERDLSPEWCGSIRQKDYLERLILGGRMDTSRADGANAAALEWFFDSDSFRRRYCRRTALGPLYAPGQTVFRLWAPTASAVSLVLYPDGRDSAPSVILPMQARPRSADGAGIWEIAMCGDLHGAYYRYRVRAHGIERDTADPYARSCGVNGARSMVVDFARVNPAGWRELASPALSSPNDAVVYELHVADLTSSPSWNGNPRLARTYLGAAERGTAFRGEPTGIDHVLALGVTHVQLMPVFDFASVDESRLRDLAYGERVSGGLFNWGYDPYLYSSPEGSYSTDPGDGLSRVRELKALIREFLANGVGVVMDVVYNHVPDAPNHPLGVCVPGYYFRLDGFSGAGDDTASEREMFRAYMIDSLSWWLSEYKLSGFRFDLMGLHDVETMNAVSTALRGIKSDVLLYGEGWDMYRAGKMVSASMRESRKLVDFGFFNDAFRRAVKGSVFEPFAGGFLHDGSHRESLKFGLVGAVFHQQVHNRFVDGTANPNPWGDRTASSANYAEIHDNATLYDKLVLVEGGRDEAYYERLQKTAISLVLLAQGMPVLHAGMEFMRTKEIPPAILRANPRLSDLYRTADGARAFSHNSYNLFDRINGLDWIRRAEKKGLVEYVRRLIAIRRAHPLFRLRTAQEAVLSILFVESETPPMPPMIPVKASPPHPGYPPALAWVIDGCATVDTWQSACVVVNPAPIPADFALPGCCNGGSWHLVTDGDYVIDESPASAPNGLPALPGGLTVSVGAKALYLYAEF